MFFVIKEKLEILVVYGFFMKFNLVFKRLMPDFFLIILIIQLTYTSLITLICQINFHFPNLTHLEILPANVIQITDSLDMTHLPQLTHLSLTSSNSGRISSFISTLPTLRHVGVTLLHVECTHYVENDNNGEETLAAVKLVHLFPP